MLAGAPWSSADRALRGFSSPRKPISSTPGKLSFLFFSLWNTVHNEMKRIIHRRDSAWAESWTSRARVHACLSKLQQFKYPSRLAQPRASGLLSKPCYIPPPRLLILRFHFQAVSFRENKREWCSHIIPRRKNQYTQAVRKNITPTQQGS